MSRPRARWHWIAEAGVLAAILSSPVYAHPPAAPPEAIVGLTGGQRPRAPAEANRPLTLYLEVQLNHTRLPELHRFELHDGKLRTDPQTLQAMGFRTPDPATGAMLTVEDLPGVQVRYQPALQRVAIDAPLSLLDADTTRLGQSSAAPQPTATAAPGLLLNYDLYASDASHGSNITASAELRVFGIGNGVFSNTAVSHRHRSRDRGWQSDSVRLDTYWELSFPEPAITATIGDTFTGFLDWTRPVRIGGVQIGRNYGLQPYRTTAPLPEFLGEAAVPSDIELYINGVRQYSGRAPVGPWELTAAPGITGAGHAQVVVTDAFGRVRNLDFPFYSTQRLLARGLSDWSVSLGEVRRAYGIRSFSYEGAPVASASWRYGVNNRFTAEAHAEGGDGLVNAGIGGAWLLGMAGVLHASHARSSLEAGSGAQTTIGYAWNNRHFNLSLDSRRTSGNYRDIASLYSLPPSPRSERATAGVRAGPLGNLSVSYTRLDHLGGDQLETSRYAGLFWSKSFAGAWSANLSVNQNVDDSRDRSLHLGVMVPLGRDHQFSTSWHRNRGSNDLVADISKPVSGELGHGWRLQARSGDRGDGGLAEATWQTELMRLGAGVSRYRGSRHSWAQASGSLVRTGGGTFAARRIHDAFAVVSAGGLAGVPVRLENRPVGETDRRGLLLVPRLNAWQRNRLSIDPLDLPADVRVGQVDLVAVPRDRSGTRVEFEVRPIRAAVVVLHDADGVPLPVGSRVRVEGRPAEAVTGFDGEVYLEQLEDDNVLQVITSGGACSVRVAYPPTDGGIPRIGPLLCHLGDGL